MTPDEGLTPKRGPGRPRKEETAGHTIYSDGTYSNAPNAVVMKTEAPAKKTSGMLHKDDPIYVGNDRVGFYYTHDLNGIWYKPSRDVDPDLTTCKHMSWAMLEAAMGVKRG